MSLSESLESFLEAFFSFLIDFSPGSFTSLLSSTLFDVVLLVCVPNYDHTTAVVKLLFYPREEYDAAIFTKC